MNEMEIIQSKIYELRGQRVMLDIAEYHFYITGHQGNIRVVASQNGEVEQVNHYYPYGGLMGESTSSDAQPYKYNGKELDRHSGLDWYDYGARWYDGMRFNTMDRFAEKYPDLSTTTYEEHVACVRENILRAENGFPLRKYYALYEGTRRPYLPSLITNPKCLVNLINGKK